MLRSSTLRPGLLVNLKTSVTGNVQYERLTIESEHRVETGASKATWETRRTINDPEELEQASKVRSKARSIISSVCAASAFGLLCPEDKADTLEAAIADARQRAEDFNANAKLTRVSVYVMTGRIAPDDVEAVRAINSEVRDLLDAMQNGVANLDVAAVREAASKAKQLGAMLSPDADARIRIAVEAAREAAKKIVKAGEQSAQEIDQIAIRRITEQRVAFLDLDSKGEVVNPTASGRAIDFAPATQMADATVTARQLELY